MNIKQTFSGGYRPTPLPPRTTISPPPRNPSACPAQAVNEDAKKPENSGTSQGSEPRSSSDVVKETERLLSRAENYNPTPGYQKPNPPPNPSRLEIQASVASEHKELLGAILGLTEAIHRQADAIGQLVAQMAAPEDDNGSPLKSPSEYL